MTYTIKIEVANNGLHEYETATLDVDILDEVSPHDLYDLFEQAGEMVA